MAQLPIVDGDDGTWGTILNEFLEVAHNNDGTLRSSAVNATGVYSKPGTGIPSSDLTNSVQTNLASASSAVQSVNGKTGNSVTLVASDVSAVPTSEVGQASGVASLDGMGNVPTTQLANVPANVHYRGAWAAKTAYAVNDAVTNNGGLYVCTTAHTSGSSFSGTDWIQLSAPNGTYVATLGISNGTGDSTAINAALTAASIAGGGTVYGLPGQSYVINAVIVIPSNVTFDFSGCKLVRASAYYGVLITNSSFTPLRTVSDAGITGGISYPTDATLTSATANFTSADVGRSVTVAGAGSNYNGFGPSDLYTTIASVTNSTTAVLTVNAPTTVSNAVLSIYGRDANVGLVADSASVIDYGTAVPSFYVVEFRRVDNLRIIGNGALCHSTVGGGEVFISPGDVTELVIDGWTFNAGTGGIQALGPLNRFSITNINGYTEDDMIALQGSGYGWPGTSNVQGNITSGYIADIFPNGSANDCIKIFGGLTQANVQTDIHGITIERIYGSIGTEGISIEMDRSGATHCGDLIIRDVLLNMLGGSGYAPVSFNSPGIRNVTVENVGSSGASGGSGAPLYLVSTYQAVVQHLIIRGVSLEQNESYVNLLQHLQNSTINLLEMSDCDIHYGSNSSLIYSDAGSSISTINLARVNCSTTGYGMQFLGSVGELNLSQVYVNGSSSILSKGLSLTNASSSTQIHAANSQIGYCQYGIFASSVTMNMSLVGCEIGASGQYCIHGDTAGTMRIRSTSTQWVGTAVSSDINVSVNGDVPLDISSSYLFPQDGDMAYNTNAALTCGAGQCIYSSGGSGHGWKSLYAGTTY